MSSVDILVPGLPESVMNATVATWHKKPGDIVRRGEILVEIETDKVVLEIPAPETGILATLLENEGAIVIAHQVLGCLQQDNSISQVTNEKLYTQELALTQCYATSIQGEKNNSPDQAIHYIVTEHNLTSKLTKDNSIDLEEYPDYKDVEKHTINDQNDTLSLDNNQEDTPVLSKRSEKRVPMTNLRKRLAERLLEAKNNTAVLTTFNEVNMQPVIDICKQYSDAFEKRHNIRLGLMSFYIKVVLEALKRFPEINASIDGEDIVYHNYFDISIAVSTPRGLVTPVLRDVDTLGMADIEKKIKELAIKGRDNQLTVEELIGGNFTITNGGIFGSLMSTPIINPPQSAILGIHAIKHRPMAVKGQVVILPMMYIALSYDHRLIDGKESVSFLMTVKQILEDPTRMLLDI